MHEDRQVIPAQRVVGAGFGRSYVELVSMVGASIPFDHDLTIEVFHLATYPGRRSRLQHSQLELGRLRQHTHIPRRVEYQLDFDVLDRGYFHELVLDLNLEDLTHAA